MSQHIQEAIDLIGTLLSSQSADTASSQPSKAQPKASGTHQDTMAASKAAAKPKEKQLRQKAAAAPTTMKAAPPKDTVLLPARLQADGAELAQSVPSLRAELTEVFRQALETAYPSANIEPVVAQTNEPKFGDYQCNNAMALFGQLKGKPDAPKNPRAVAEAIVAALPSAEYLADPPTLAGPGFINTKISSRWLGTRIQNMLRNGICSWAPRLNRTRVVIDFSSPNVAKEMHVGHLRSTIIGDTLARTLEFCGADVLRLNHVGDWGTQFGMLIQFLAEAGPGGLTDPAIADLELPQLQGMYKASKKRFDEDAEFKERARKAVTMLQRGDAEVITAWERICEASRKGYQAVYARLGVRLKERGESFYNPMLPGLVQMLMEQGVAEESEGAKVIFVKDKEKGPPLIVQKSDGGFGYATTDMAAIRHRLQDEKGEWLIYVTDMGQAPHFEAIFAGAQKAGFIKPLPSGRMPRLDHIGFGVVLGEDGKRIATRSGESVRLVELLDEAKLKCKGTISERRQISEEELDKSSGIMGYAAVKYADLKNNRTTNYKFMLDDMLSLQGNTAVYLLYAHARIAAIGRKAGIENIASLADDHSIEVDHEKERALAMHVVRFPEAVEAAVEELMPNRITDYLYDLSEKFNGFYTECHVVGDKQQTSRLLLCEATAVVMRQCFDLLGMTPMYQI
ncbi:hypothetical protein ABBQ32_012100 [Trebouxia sp. C0010 RCD-2024]